MSRLATVLIAIITMMAFAGNSILCRLALASESISPTRFTAVRLIAGALVLLPILALRKNTARAERSLSISLALCLFAYAIFFAVAYVDISASTGALLLFPTVQVTMIGYAVIGGKKLNRLEWVGGLLAFMGLLYLLLPGVKAPPVIPALLMILAGISWAAYSLIGKRVRDPIAATARNFLYTVPLAGILLCIPGAAQPMTRDGLLLAILSGALTSGMGYILWYTLLKRITSVEAALLQLTVPLLTAFVGVSFLHEPLSLRLVVAAVLVVTGVLLTTPRPRLKNL